MTDDEAVAEYQKTYTATQRAADEFEFVLEKIRTVGSVFFRQWKGNTFRPDALRQCLDNISTEKKLRDGRQSWNPDWPTGDDIHNALGDWKAKRKAAGAAWESIPLHRKSALQAPETLDR